MSPDKKEITVNELVDQYYNNPEDYFSLSTLPETDSEIVYSQSSENKCESQETSEDNIQSISTDTKVSEKLGGIVKSPNYLIFPEFIKCSFQGCKFENIHQDTIDQHFRLTHKG